jgi:hypothetical protein
MTTICQAGVPICNIHSNARKSTPTTEAGPPSGEEKGSLNLANRTVSALDRPTDTGRMLTRTGTNPRHDD